MKNSHWLKEGVWQTDRHFSNNQLMYNETYTIIKILQSNFLSITCWYRFLFLYAMRITRLDDIFTWTYLIYDSYINFVTGVSRVEGSSPLQTAYRLDREADLTLPTRDIFPQGLPDNFSFICTFRTRKLLKSAWHIVRLVDLELKPQFLITINPRKQSIELSLPDYEGKLQTVIFKKAHVSTNLTLCLNL